LKAQNDKCKVCLPVGIWNKKYSKFLNNSTDEGYLKNFESYCTATKTCFEIKGINFDLKYEKRKTIIIQNRTIMVRKTKQYY
jgi:ribosomal protein S8